MIDRPGCVIKLHDSRRDSILRASAGTLACSTSAETDAALLGISKVESELKVQHSVEPLAIHQPFDSRVLFHLLHQPTWRLNGSTARNLAVRLGCPDTSAYPIMSALM